MQLTRHPHSLLSKDRQRSLTTVPRRHSAPPPHTTTAQTAPLGPEPAKAPRAPKRASPAKPTLSPEAAAAVRAAEAAAAALPEIDEHMVEWFAEGMVHEDDPEPPLAGQKVG